MRDLRPVSLMLEVVFVVAFFGTIAQRVAAAAERDRRRERARRAMARARVKVRIRELEAELLD